MLTLCKSCVFRNDKENIKCVYCCDYNNYKRDNKANIIIKPYPSLKNKTNSAK